MKHNFLLSLLIAIFANYSNAKDYYDADSYQYNEHRIERLISDNLKKEFANLPKLVVFVRKLENYGFLNNAPKEEYPRLTQLMFDFKNYNLFYVDNKIKTKYPALIKLILEIESMEDEEKIGLFNKLVVIDKNYEKDGHHIRRLNENNSSALKNLFNQVFEILDL